MGCVGAECSPGTVLWYGCFLDAEDRLTGHAIQNVHVANLACLREDRRFLPIDHQVDQAGGRRQIEIPQVVMNSLEIPLELSRLRVECYQRIAEQVIALAVEAVKVARRAA